MKKDFNINSNTAMDFIKGCPNQACSNVGVGQIVYKPKLFYFFIVCLMMVQSGCNIFEESGSLPNLVVEVAPSGVAGSVLTSGQGSENGEISLTAIPNSNWTFSHWSGDVSSGENPYTFVLEENTQVFANFVITGIEAGILLTVTDGEFVSNLRFGRLEGATDSFDSGIDLEAPPPPPSGVLYAWFESGNRRLLRDFRNPFSTNSVWDLQIMPGNESQITLSWNIGEDEFAGSLMLISDDHSVEINMREVNELEIEVHSQVQYQIIYTS